MELVRRTHPTLADPYGLDRLCGGGQRAVPCPDQPNVYSCVKDSREPMKVCAGRNDEYGCMSKGAATGDLGNSRHYIGGGGYVDVHFLIAGLTAEDSKIIDGSGKSCRFQSECVSVGPGVYFGGGITAPFGIAKNDIEKSLAGDSVSLSFDFGVCLLAKGYSAAFGYNENGITSVGSAKGFARGGIGCGLSISLDFCETTALSCDR